MKRICRFIVMGLMFWAVLVWIFIEWFDNDLTIVETWRKEFPEVAR